jgi:hypothetical protein
MDDSEKDSLLVDITYRNAQDTLWLWIFYCINIVCPRRSLQILKTIVPEIFWVFMFQPLFVSTVRQTFNRRTFVWMVSDHLLSSFAFPCFF